MRKSKAMFVTWCLTLLVGACSGSRGSGGERHDGLSTFDPVAGMEVREGQVPISESDRALIAKAESRLNDACMEEQGFPANTLTERTTHPDPPPYLSPAELRRGGYQFDFAAEAESEAAVNGAAGPASPTDQMSDRQRKEYDRAMNGPADGPRVALPTSEGEASTPERGCTAVARNELYGSLLNFLRYDRAWQGTAMSALRNQLARTRAYKRPLQAWQQCMADTSGLDLAADIADGLDYGVTALRRMVWVNVANGEPPPEQSQIDAVADADADCQESSGLDTVRERLLPDVQEAVLKQLGLESAELVAFENAVLEKAKTVR